MDRSKYPVRKISPRDEGGPAAENLTAEERLRMVWTLTLQAWGFNESDEPRLRRDIVRTLRGKR
jgi:hypothetical protein